MVKKIDVKKGITYSTESVVSKQIMNSKAGSVTLFAFAKGQSLSEHTAPFDAMAQVTEGIGKFTIGGKANRVSTGELIIMPANVTHAVMADEKFKMLLTMIRG
ncbi:MAG: cupin domain-containing protein [Spirochaetia bacterium]|nr:cupin domain-containing protein [Spirochaetia bacterium]